MPTYDDDSEVCDTDDIEDILRVVSKAPPAQYQRQEADMEVGAYGSSDDPFGKRDGKTLMWKNINMTLVRFSRDFRCTHCRRMPSYQLQLLCLISVTVGGARRQTRAQASVGCVG
jgi:hypothetical protein